MACNATQVIHCEYRESFSLFLKMSLSLNLFTSLGWVTEYWVSLVEWGN